MSGKLYVTEYNNYGDPSMTVPREPSALVQKVDIGSESDELHQDTRIIALWSTVPCLFQFLTDSEEPDIEHATPLAEYYEIVRIVHMGRGQRIATFDLDE